MRTKPVVLAACASLALAGLATVPSAAEPVPAYPPTCVISADTATHVTETAYRYDAYDYVATKGAKVKIRVKFSNRLCNGRAVTVKVGKKTVAKGKIKGQRFTFTVPASYAKKTGKWHKFVVRSTTDDLQYNVMFATGSLKTDKTVYDAYMDNDFLVKSTAVWKGQYDGAEVWFYQGKFPTDSQRDTWIATTLGKDSGKGIKGNLDTWVRVGNSRDIFRAVGTYAVKASIAIDRLATPRVAGPSTSFTVNVHPNEYSVANGTMLAPGIYDFPLSWYGGSPYCRVKVYGPVKPNGDTRWGYDVFYSTADRNPEGTAIRVQVIATDTSVQFSDCGGGPVQVG
jgi:hypothetical protein